MKKFYVLLAMVVLLLSSASAMSFEEKASWVKGFQISIVREDLSYKGFGDDTKIVDVRRYDRHTVTKLSELDGEEQVSRIYCEVSFVSKNFRISGIVGTGNLAYDYYRGTIETVEKYDGWDGQFERQHDFTPFKNKSELGLIFGGEIEWTIPFNNEHFFTNLTARYLWQDESSVDSNIHNYRTEGFGWMSYGYYAEQANIRKMSHSEFSAGFDMSYKTNVGNAILHASAGIRALFLGTTYSGVGYQENWFHDSYYGSYDSFYDKNEFEIRATSFGFVNIFRVGVEMNFAELFIQGQVGFAPGISAGLNFKLF
ncbi:MAG: hypothetical protein V1686_00070 [Patescibacteria group bacterium]